jgi:transmembrane sensor
MSDAPANPIDAIACQWAARLDRGLAGEEEAALDAWLALDPRHRGALLRAQAGMALLDRCRALHDDDAPEQAPHGGRCPMGARHPAPSPGAGRRGRGRRADRCRRPRALAAGFGHPHPHRRNAPRAARRWIDGRGQQRQRAECLVHPRRRDVDLAQGEAWFQVAKAPDRPFTVTAGRVRVQAVGTAFNVRRAGVGVDVVVTEGTVKVWSEGAEPQLVKAGQRARLDDGVGLAVSPIAADAAQQELAWREGQIVLDDVTLAQAAQRFNAYHEDRLEVDPALADKRVVGSFQTNDMDGFAQACAAMVGGRVERGNGVIRILR